MDAPRSVAPPDPLSAAGGGKGRGAKIPTRGIDRIGALYNAGSQMNLSLPSSPSWFRSLRRDLWRLPLLRGCCLIAALAGLISPARHATPATGRPAGANAAVTTGEAQRFRNLGKAYYEQGKYDDAVAWFEKVVGAGQPFSTDHFNLGLALLQDNQLDQALGQLTTAQQMDSKLLAVHYNLGILYKREQRYPDAEAELKHMAGSDPSDPAVWFNLGTVYFAEKKLSESLDAFQRVATMGFGRAQNFYVAATFHIFTILTRLRRPDEAQKFLKINQSLREKVPNISIQYPALEAGRYGAILVPPAPPNRPSTTSNVSALADVTSRLQIRLASSRPQAPEPGEIKASDYSLDFARRAILPMFPLSVAIGDYDGDGHPDVYVVEPGGRNHLLHNNGKGSFADVTEKAGVAGEGRGVSAVFADYDNSGHPSLLVAGLGGVTVYHNRGDGTFSNETAKAGITAGAGELDTKIIAFDSDNDGFLDIVTTAYTELNSPPHKPSFRFPQDFEGTTSHLYRNNGDGTFADITAASGLGAARGKMRSAIFADFNDDGYADLIFLREDGAPLLYLNQGEDKFKDASAEAGATFSKLPAVDAEVADFNHDGMFDLVLWSPQGYNVLLGLGGGRFEAVDLPPALPLASSPFAAMGVLADLNGDGFDDLVASDSSGRLHAILNEGGHFRESVEVGPAQGSVSAVLAATSLVNPARLDLLTSSSTGELRVLEGPAAHWSAVTLDGYKSNKQGIGCVVEFKSGDYYKKVLATGAPVRVFTGKLDKLDVVRVTWPNLIVENDVDVAGGKPVDVRESERLASSCPFLYVWNGRRFVFLSDIMGVAPLGELAPDGTRVRPNPDQLVNLGSGLRAQNGRFTFQVTSEMRETDYFDQLRLAAIDHPAAESVYANEIYASAPSSPEIYAVHQTRLPLAATDDRGRDVLALIREVDGRYPTGFRQDRILGLADQHTLTLDLGPFSLSADPALWFTGWVLWTDSNASRALETNKHLTMISPYLQVRDRHGNWVTAIPDMGLPSGTNRTFRVDLAGKFPSADHHVRIVTNLCVYWDRILLSLDDRRLADPFATHGAGSPGAAKDRLPLRASELPLDTAELRYRGFSTPISDAHHLKPDNFDYSRRLADAPWNPFGGHYTRYGAVKELLTAGDDRLVVMAAGDEITVSFDARGLPPLPAGWRRNYVLYARGYAKDGEPNTAAFRTAEPLPFYRMSAYPYPAGERGNDPAVRDYMDSYETRSGYELIPRLAP